MIQRIQSIFILGFILFSAATLFLPLAEYGNSEQIVTVYATEISSDKPSESEYLFHYLIALVALANTLLGFRILFLFKNRIAQMKMLRVGSFLSIILIGIIFFVIEHSRTFYFDAETPIAYGMGIYFPLAAIVMSIVGNRFIKKDEDLVRSINRIR